MYLIFYSTVLLLLILYLFLYYYIFDSTKLYPNYKDFLSMLVIPI